MCRIVGRVSKHIDFFQPQLQAMLESVAHGGPDDTGTHIEDGISLGHKRLSIIETGPMGHQPMSSQSNDLVITFNGEIYNYQKLQKELQTLGHVFFTNTDTEVILVAFEQWGTASFNKLEGIFAFALWDKSMSEFYLVRDHIGIKPLYYYLNRHELIFSSEVRAFTALEREWKEYPNWKILFLAFGSIPFPFTTLDKVVQLQPGSYLKLELTDFTFEKYRYHRFPDFNYSLRSNDQALKATRESVFQALKKNLVSDVPIGIFLSGGIDSGLLAVVADKMTKNVRTLSVNFDESLFDERANQQNILEQTNNIEHISHRVSEQMFWTHLPDIWAAMDQPSIDGVNSYFVARCAKLGGLKVALSGVGADESFGGYSSFSRIKWMKGIGKLPFLPFLASLARRYKKPYGRLTYLSLPGVVGNYLFLRGIFLPKEIAAILQIPEEQVWSELNKIQIPDPINYSDVEYASFLESTIYLTNQLLKDTDYMGMWHGVEIRVPFLDIELLKTVRSIPPHLRYKANHHKYLLTESHKDVLPRKVISQKKKGFTFPFKIWMRNENDSFRKLLAPNSFDQSIFNDFLQGKGHWSKSWSLAVLQQFAHKQK